MRLGDEIRKKIGKTANVKVVFSAPSKLGKLSKLTNPNRPTPDTCNKRHRKRFVACARRVVYSLPLNCTLGRPGAA